VQLSTMWEVSITNIVFDSENSFSGLYWDGKTKIYGTRASSQSQQQQAMVHQFLDKTILGSTWDVTINNQYAYSFTLGNGTVDHPDPTWKGVTWVVTGQDLIEFQTPDKQQAMGVSFSSVNNFSGYSWDRKTPVAGTRRGNQQQPNQQQQQQQTFQHRFINSIQAKGWNFNIAGQTYTFDFGNTTIDNFSSPDWPTGVIYSIVGPDQLKFQYPNSTYQMTITFNSLNSFTGFSWDGTTPVSGTNSQNQQQQTFQHRFINNIIGTSWNIMDRNGSGYTFSIGDGTIYNFSVPGVGWEGVTWKVTGNDKIQFRATNGAIMDLTFNDQSNFSGFYWNNTSMQVTGTKR
jgi:hypothetical protein